MPFLLVYEYLSKASTRKTSNLWTEKTLVTSANDTITIQHLRVVTRHRTTRSVTAQDRSPILSRQLILILRPS